MNPRSLQRRSRELLESVGLGRLDPGALLSSLSIGERQLVEIARALGQGPRLVVLDEPTATLNDAESELVYEGVRRIARAGCSVIFVSHRLREVLTLCETVTVLRDGELVATTPAADLTVDALIEQMLGEQISPPVASEAFDGSIDHALSIRHLGVPRAVHDFELDAFPGRVYGLAGQVGSGTSDVLRALAGLHPAATGQVLLRGRRVPLGHPRQTVRAGIAFVSNDRKGEGLFLAAPVWLNLIATRLSELDTLGLRAFGRERRAASRLRDAAAIVAPSTARVGDLSGGNQQKVFVGRALHHPGTHVLLVDEPTRGVDIGGRAAIHDLMRSAAAEGLVVVFTSTETEELTELADVIVTMRDGARVGYHATPPSTATILRETTHDDGGEL